MSILDIFSKRQKKLRGDVPDVYTYDSIPEPLKVQIIHIWREQIGDEDDYRASYGGGGTYGAYKYIVEKLCREYGLFFLPGSKSYSDRNFLSELAGAVLVCML